MTATNTNSVGQLLSEAAEQIRREAYAAGWRDAIAAVNAAANQLSEPSVSEGMNLQDFGPQLPLASGGPKVGSTPFYVLQAVHKRPGMSGSEVVEFVTGGGHRVAEGSIRTSLARLRNRKLIVSRHGKWFPG